MRNTEREAKISLRILHVQKYLFLSLTDSSAGYIIPLKSIFPSEIERHLFCLLASSVALKTFN